MKLQTYIDSRHEGNVSAYARTIGITRQHVQKWLGWDCTIKNGIVTRHKDLYVPAKQNATDSGT